MEINLLRFKRRVFKFLTKLNDFLPWHNLEHISIEISIPFEYAGTPGYSQYAFSSSNLPRGGVVYSLGVGEDVSFDKEIINCRNVDLHAFDFTPRSKIYLDNNPTKGLNFHSYGVAAIDGELIFYAPYQSKNVSWSKIPRGTRTEIFPVKRLSSIMRELKHSHLDLLKMDIEGAEYEVLDDMLASGIRPTQLLVEFQHRFEGVGVSKTRKTLKKLKEAEYKIFYISPDKTEFSFILEIGKNPVNFF